MSRPPSPLAGPARRLLSALVVAAAPGVLHAQITLADAIHRADAAAFPNRSAAATANLANAGRLAPMRGILPSFRLEGGYLRTTDPIGAFGTRLKQRDVAGADFDPARLNFPAAVGNYSAGLVAEQPLLNADSWMARRAASRSATANESAAQWTRLTTRVDVIRAYYGAVLADERAAMLDAAAAAARAHVGQAESMVRAGMATKSDALLASVRAGEIETQRIEAHSDVGIARRQLALLIGLGANVETQVPSRLPSAEAIRLIVADDSAEKQPAARFDVDAAKSYVGAARADVQRARSLYLPRVNTFARNDWNSPQRLYGGDRSWTVGILASWTLFEGGSQLTETQTAAARLELASSAADAAADQARLDTQRSLATLRAALARLDIAERAVAQSIEAHRIVTRKYEGGLATVTELLDAATTETGTTLALSSAKYGVIAALAERRRALGGDPATLVALDNASVAANP